MPTERWQRVEQLFTEAAAAPPHGRPALLARRCGPDTGLRDELTSLLAAADRSGDFLDAPALELFARQITAEGWSVKPGDRIASYSIERRLGAGGMGEVWRARDQRLGRDVAIKLLLPHPADQAQRVRAFQREAQAAGALNHPNVLTIHDVGEHDGAPYLVSECLEGEPLRARLGAGPLPLDQALDIALQLARGLGAAHAHGIVHRDLKPENIFLLRDGRVKILDFGLATLHGAPAADLGGEPPPELTRSLLAGTAGYMAPEQLRGEPVDRRADIFAFGAVLHELCTGRGPFSRPTTLGTLEAVLSGTAPDLADARLPAPLCTLVRRCLAHAPQDRHPTIDEVAAALAALIRTRATPAPPGLHTLLRRPAWLAGTVLLLLALGAGIWRWQALAGRARWARTVAAPEVERLAKAGHDTEAYLLARRALDVVPDDPHLQRLWQTVSFPSDMTTEPPGAAVSIAPYRGTPAGWFPLGHTPLTGVRVPGGMFRVRVNKPGFVPIEGTGASCELQGYRLDPLGTVPPGMVRIVRGRPSARCEKVGELDDYWIDRFEVTNRAFKAFVDQGGYQRPAYWREPFIDEAGRTLTREQAMARFRDASGKPGPATWSHGTYPEGQADHPVGGVSFYEAAAYLAFAGKSLPTMYHWYRAAGLSRFDDMLAVSNFEGQGPVPVGSRGGLGPFGTEDMVGNVREWSSTVVRGRRLLLGGAWNEPRYLFDDDDPRDPFERAPAFGFRGVKYLQPPPPAVLAPVETDTFTRDARAQVPVGDDIFAVYRRLYAYDRTPLDPAVEASEETERGRKLTVSFAAAPGGERLRAMLFLPRDRPPPYQTVLFFPPGDAFILRASRDMSLTWPDFVTGSGRALFWPVYQGTFERSTGEETPGPNAERALMITWARELGRAIDYLESRPDLVDPGKLAYLGISAGGLAGVVLTALEPRLRASVLQGTGIAEVVEPEVDPLNFAPRVKLPTLMLNGRYDVGFPCETAQQALFDRLGTPAADKRHLIFSSGHRIPLADTTRETLAWLDRYLGPTGLPKRR